MGILLVIPSIGVIKDGYFYRDKISRKFTRSQFEKDPSFLIDYYQALYDLRYALKDNKIQYNIIYKKKEFGRHRRTEFQIIGKPFSIIIEPNYGYHTDFLGITISIGPNVIKDDPDVWQMITLIEQTFTPRSG